MKISVSILDCDYRIDSVKKLNFSLIDYIHIDVMDGSFVPRVSFGDIDEIRNISKISKYPLDVHLMVDNPSIYIKSLNKLNIEYITFHIEVKDDINNIIKLIKNNGYKVGISIKPGTDINIIKPYLEYIDLILIMSVEPGMGGQTFIDTTINKLDDLKKLVIDSGRDILIEVDGGINNETIKKITNADIAVVGSYITKSNNYELSIKSLQ